MKSALKSAAEVAAFLIAGLLLLAANALDAGGKSELPGGSSPPQSGAPQSSLAVERGPVHFRIAQADGAGMASPGAWITAFEAGFRHYSMQDYESAAAYFTFACGLPDHPEYIDRFAALAAAKAGDVVGSHDPHPGREAPLTVVRLALGDRPARLLGLAQFPDTAAQ